MYAENGTGPVATYTAEDPEGTAITWSLSGTDEGDFDIDEGVLTFKQSPNYEMATGGGPTGMSNTYSVMVVATDSSTASDTVEVTVNVTNVDEAGMLTLSTLQPVDGILLDTEFTDIDGEPSAPTWKWEKSTIRTSGWTVIDGAIDAMYTPAAYRLGQLPAGHGDLHRPRGIRQGGDGRLGQEGAGERSTNTVPVFRDADDEGIVDNTAITRDVPENSDAGTNVGDPVAAYDAEGDVLTYTISDDADSASFDIDRATGQIMVGAGTELNYDVEDERSYTVMVTATGPGHGDDAADDTDTITVTINVTNVDEDPELTGMDSLRQMENTAITVPRGTYMASDDEDTANVALTLSGTDASDFTLTDDNGNGTYELAFKAVPDFEMAADTGGNNVYNITVTATDSDGQTDTMAVVVTVTNVEEDGTVTLNTLQPRVGIGVMATLTDLDGATTDVTWKWQGQTSSTCSVPLVMDGIDDLEGGISGTYTPTAADIGKCLGATASYTDPQGSDTAMSVLLMNSDRPVEEDGHQQGADLPRPGHGDRRTPDGQERTVAENTAENRVTGANIGDVVKATDPNEDYLTYTLGGMDMASFGIDRGTGQLMTKAMLNKEGKDTYMVTVTATDPSGLSAAINVTIKVTNVDEDPVIMRAPDANVAPEFASATTSRTVAENTAAGEDIGNPVAANDANGDTLTYALVGTDAASFNIGSATGQLITKAALDYEAKASYVVTVTATDPDSASDMITVTITVTNVDEMMGEVTLWASATEALTMAPQVGDTITGAVMDPDGGVTVDSWQWAKTKTPDMMESWMPITGATAAAYMVTEGDTGYYLRVMATYTDAVGTDTAMVDSIPTMMVTAVDEMMGEVTLWAGLDALTMAPQVGDTITGAVMDPDGGVTDETWQWSRTMDTANMSSWMDIEDATAAAYMVTADDTGYYLRVMATYTDAVGTDMGYSMPTMMVGAEAGDTLVDRYDLDNNGIDKTEVLKAINDYLFDEGDEAISRPQVLRLINLYLFSP